MPLAQAYPKTSMSSKASKIPSASRNLAGEHLPSLLEAPGSSTSEKEYLETLPICLSALCAQRTIEYLSSVQDSQKAFPSSIRYSGQLPHLPGDQVPSSLA